MRTIEEIWKDIEWCSDYQVSTEGRVKSFKRGKEKLLTPTYDKNGYPRVHLSNRKEKYYPIHRLVAETFIPNPKNKPQVNHINGCKTDNRIENLEWCTNSENQLHAYNIGIKKPSEKQREFARQLGKINSKTIVQYDTQGNFIKEWESMSEVARQIKINHSHISECCNGKRKTAGGYTWKFREEVA